MIQLAKLQQGLLAMQLDLDKVQQQKLLDYITLLKKWNSTYNLTALRHDDLMLSHHVLDSLSILPFVKNAHTLIDVGSGGGMPGIPVAIAKPELKVTLLDSNSKKTTFLQQAVIELDLANISVITGRVEATQGQLFDVITSRAFAELKDFTLVTRQLLAENGQWLAMKGVHPYEELAQLPDFVQVDATHKIVVPDVEGDRCIIIMSQG